MHLKVFQWLALSTFLAACREPSGNTAQPTIAAMPPDAAAESIPQFADAGPPIPLSLEPKITVQSIDGGTAEVDAHGLIEPSSGITVNLPVKLIDFRVRVFDWRDQLVVSDDELLGDGTYHVTFAEPLKPGRTYMVLLDSEFGPVMTDENGRTYNDWDMPLHISGEIQAEPQRGSKKKSLPARRKHRAP
jgi:hypothetical protein